MSLLKRPELLLVALTFSAALDATGRLADIGGLKITIYQGFLLVAVIVAVLRLKRDDVKIPRTPVDLWIVILIASAAAALIGATSLTAGLVAFVSLCSSVALVYLVPLLAPTSDRLRTVLVSLLTLGALLGVAAIIERMGIWSLQPFYTTYADGIRARVTFHDTNTLGGVLAAAAATGVPLALSAPTLKRKLLLWGCVGASMAGVVATLSRGALLGLVAGLLVVLFLAPMARATRIGLGAAGVGGAFALLTVVLDPAWVAEKLTGITGNNSALYRIYLARSAVRMFLDHPFGVGPGNWPVVITAYRDPQLPVNLLASHTTIVTVLVESGPMAALALIGTVVGTAAKSVRASLKAPTGRALVAAPLAGLAVLLVQSMTYSIETSKFLWLLIGAALAAVAAAWAPDREMR